MSTACAPWRPKYLARQLLAGVVGAVGAAGVAAPLQSAATRRGALRSGAASGKGLLIGLLPQGPQIPTETRPYHETRVAREGSREGSREGRARVARGSRGRDEGLELGAAVSRD